jgi:hypothetical protein
MLFFCYSLGATAFHQKTFQHFIECPYTMSLYPNNAAQCQLPKLQTEAVFLVMCDPFINELCVT